MQALYTYDESVVARWVENPYWQYFCGFEHLQHQLPLHPTSLIKWRNRVGDKLDALLTETIKVASENQVIKASETKHVNVDSTVQEKNITFPTDAKQTKKLKTYLGRVIRDIRRKSQEPNLRLSSLLHRAEAIHKQQENR